MLTISFTFNSAGRLFVSLILSDPVQSACRQKS